MNFLTKSFAAGEITPALYGRVDLSKYSTGVRTMRNFYVSRSGGAYNRPGTKYCATPQDPTRAVRLIRFTTANGVKYQLELGHQYIRPLDQGVPIMTGPVQVSSSTSSGTNSTYVLSTFGGFVVGDQVTITGQYSLGAAQRTGAITSMNTGGTSITTNIDTSNLGSFQSGSISPVTPKIVTYAAPWTDVQLKSITFTQDGNSIIFASNAFYPQAFTYQSRQQWIFANIGMAPKTATPANLAISTALGTAIYFGVTAVDGDTFEESFVTVIGGNNPPSQTQPMSIQWDPVPGAIEYNVYCGLNATNLGFKAVSYGTVFADNGSLQIDFSDPPPIPRSFFSVPNSTLPQYPAAVGQFQQRRWYGNIGPVSETLPTSVPVPLPVPTATDRIIGSRIGSPTFFALNRPTGDDDPVNFRMVHKEPQAVRHFMDLGKFVVFTEQGEWIIQGGDSGISPSQINPTCVSQNGSSYLAPLQIGNVALYRQNKGSIVRTFGFEFQIEGYRGDDLTTFSKHLVDKQQIVAWDFQKLPDPVVWMARDDGVMLGLTFVPEQAIVAWHRHDFVNGFVEDVCQSDDRIYLVIRRVINGVTTRYIERLHTRETLPITKAVYVDASLTYDGTTTGSVTLSGGTIWDNGDQVTVTASGITFSAGNLPGAIHVTGTDGTFIRITGISFVSANVVTGTPSRLVPVTMRNVALTNVIQARSIITGLAHLEGQQVSVIGDGFVVSSPNNPSYPTLTVTGGQVTLPQAYGVVHVGLPITADLETLNIDTAQGQTIMDKQKAITKVSMWVEQTRGLYIGGVPQEGTSLNALQGLEPTVTSFFEPKVRYSEGFSKPNNLLTRVIDQNISGAWTSHGRVIVRQVDPLPCAVLSIAPAGLAPVGM